MIALHTSSGTKRIVRLHVKTATGTKLVRNAYLRTAAGLRKFFGDLAVTLSGPSAVGASRSSATALTYSNSVTATVSGATGTVTHNWAQVSGGAITPTNPTGAETAFTAYVDPTTAVTGVFQDTVIDSKGATAVSPQVTVSLRNFGGGTY